MLCSYVLLATSNLVITAGEGSIEMRSSISIGEIVNLEQTVTRALAMGEDAAESKADPCLGPKQPLTYFFYHFFRRCCNYAGPLLRQLHLCESGPLRRPGKPATEL